MVQEINILYTLLCIVVAVPGKHINGEGEESKPEQSKFHTMQPLTCTTQFYITNQLLSHHCENNIFCLLFVNLHAVISNSKI